MLQLLASVAVSTEAFTIFDNKASLRNCLSRLKTFQLKYFESISKSSTVATLTYLEIFLKFVVDVF